MIRRNRPARSRADTILEVVCVTIVILSLIALVAWIVTHAGGGVLNQG